MSEPQLTTRAWYPGIEALRGIAALTVVFHHMWSLSSMPRFPGYWIVEGFGSWGVNLFFVLSGFLLADAFWQSKAQSLPVYGLRRFFRLAPAYYVNVTILFLFFASNSVLFSAQGIKQIAAQYTFTHYLFADTSSSLNVNGALWTLTIEMLLYLFLPVMALSMKRLPLITFAALVGIGVGWRLWIALDGDALRAFFFGGDTGLDPAVMSLFIARQFPGVVPIFALGIGLRWLSRQGHLEWVEKLLPAKVPVTLVAVLLIPSILMLHEIERGVFYTNPGWFATFDMIVVLLLLPALVVAARPDSLHDSPLRVAATWAGERSYSIYLWHFPLILAFYERGPFEAMPTATGYWWRLPAILVLTFVAAEFSYRSVERPGQEFGRRLASRYLARRQASRSGPRTATTG